ncbi:MAG: hypothetical protein ABI395_03160 [Sphingobium sp.]
MNTRRVILRIWIVFAVFWVAAFGLKYRLAQNAHEDAVSAVRIANVSRRIYEDAGLLDPGEAASPEQEELAASTDADADEALQFLLGGLIVGSLIIAALHWIVSGAAREDTTAP